METRTFLEAGNIAIFYKFSISRLKLDVSLECHLIQRPERLSVDQEEAMIKILNLLETIFQYVPKPRAK